MIILSNNIQFSVSMFLKKMFYVFLRQVALTRCVIKTTRSTTFIALVWAHLTSILGSSFDHIKNSSLEHI
jgi:hypothetical protein